MDEILRPHPHQHKEIDLFLGSFPLATTFGNQQLYAKPKPALPDSEEAKAD